MKKNILISGFFNPVGVALANAFKSNSMYVYGIDKKEDYEGVCDRAFRFDINKFASDAGYRIRFTQIFGEIIPRLDALILCDNAQIEGKLRDIQLEHWHESMNSNVTGPMLLCKLFRQRLEKSNGTILFVGANLKDVKDSQSIGYKTSRAALEGLYQSIAQDLEGKVNADRIVCNFTESSTGEAALGHQWKTLAEMAVSLIVSKEMRGSILLDF